MFVVFWHYFPNLAVNNKRRVIIIKKVNYKSYYKYVTGDFFLIISQFTNNVFLYLMYLGIFTEVSTALD